MTPATRTDTRTRLLDAAEELFAERGYARASMRELTARAAANLAAVGYHFGGKEELFRAVVLRRVREVNAVRLVRLDALEDAAEPPSVEAVVEAFVGPALELVEGPRGAHFLRLVARLHVDTDGPGRRALESGCFDEVAQRFRAALRRELAELEEDELDWRMHFMVGAMIHAVLHPALLCSVDDAAERAPARDASRAELVRFLAGALRAPARSAPSDAAVSPPGRTAR